MNPFSRASHERKEAVKLSVKPSVSLSVVRRLPRYYRFLGELKKSGCTRISSRELSERMGLTASQIRQDLNCFGGFGQQGYGYNVVSLYEEIAKILGLDHKLDAILIGVGNLGKAVASHMNFAERGFRLIGLFDSNPSLIGKELSGIKIMDTSELQSFCEERKPTVAILCIPKAAAESLGKRLLDCGIRCFWNFSHYDFTLEYDDVIVENVHLSDSLMTLGSRVNEKLRGSKS